jgi:hypothetical protein
MPTHKRDQEANPSSSPDRRSFLLRCWRERDDTRQGGRAWRFTLRTVSDEPKEWAFSTLGQLIDSLLSELFASKPGEKE